QPVTARQSLQRCNQKQSGYFSPQTFPNNRLVLHSSIWYRFFDSNKAMR
ncbi:hypothetical protein A5876_003124, partial [Enterococcus sp. 3C8_DIV0646]